MMMDIIVKIVVELLSVLALATCDQADRAGTFQEVCKEAIGEE